MARGDSNIRGAAKGLKAAGVTKKEAEKLSPKELVQKAESTGETVTYSDAAAARRSLRDE